MSTETAVPSKATISPLEVATIFGVGRDTVYLWIKEGRLPPPIRIGRVIRWRREVIEKILDGE
jgi:excisionase family DNA binding protein